MTTVTTNPYLELAIDLQAWRVAIKQDDMPANIQRIEQRLRSQLRREFGRTLDGILGEITRLGRVGNRLPSPDTVDDVLEALTEARRRIPGRISDTVQSVFNTARRNIIRDLRRQGFDIALNDFSPQVSNMLRDRTFQAAQTTMNRITGDIMGNLRNSYEQGLGIDDAARQLREVSGQLRDFETRRIARTEINRSQSDAAHRTIKDVAQYKRWITAIDGRERESHAEVNGEITEIDQLFSNGLQHPHDFDNADDLGEVINCRCREVPFIMPRGKMPPHGATHFRENELVDVGG